jgi:hypothetical protein
MLIIVAFGLALTWPKQTAKSPDLDEVAHRRGLPTPFSLALPETVPHHDTLWVFGSACRLAGPFLSLQTRFGGRARSASKTTKTHRDTRVARWIQLSLSGLWLVGGFSRGY